MGDFFQLAVKQLHLFAEVCGSLWIKLGKIFELHQNLRKRGDSGFAQLFNQV